MSKDSVRAETLFSSFAMPGHCWRLFGWGNLKSLEEEPKMKGVELHPELQRFFAEHYQVREVAEQHLMSTIGPRRPTACGSASTALRVSSLLRRLSREALGKSRAVDRS